MSKNSIKIFMLLILISTILFSGCVEQEKYPLKYYSEKNPVNYIILYGDGKYVVSEGSKGLSGSYKVENDTVFLILEPFGTTYRLKKENGALIDEDGGKWIKK
jgi:hypothetical protein